MKELQLLTCDEVAEILRISADTVRHLAASGELPGRKIGRAWRFPRVAIESFLLQTAATAGSRGGAPAVTGQHDLANLGNPRGDDAS